MELDTPEWPEFGVQEGKFMELKLDGSQVIDTPHRERLHSFKRHVSSARRRQLDVDRPSTGKGRISSLHNKLSTWFETELSTLRELWMELLIVRTIYDQ